MPKDISFDTRDEYQRRPIAEKIIQLLASDIEVSPMIIDGSWGTGKTEFCQKLIALVKSDEETAPFLPVYIDAFRADHADQPLMTLLAAILSLLPETERPALINKALPALRFGMKTAGKALIGWALKQDAVELGEDLEDALKTTGETLLDKATESLLQDHMKAEQSIRTLQSVLASIAENKPMVLFIDELDRCRPDFALSMLEIIKHIFDVDGVQFVLITNTQQLKAAINHCYGNEVDAQRYLDKFIAFSFRLPAEHKDQYRSDNGLAAQTHFANLVRDSKLLQHSGIAEEGILSVVKKLISVGEHSLREVETLVKYLEIYQVLTNNKGLGNNDSKIIFGYLLLYVYAIYCASFHPTLAKTFLNGKYSPEAVAQSLGHLNLEEFASDLPFGSRALLAMLVIDAPNAPNAFRSKDEKMKERWSEIISGAFERGFYRVGEHEDRLNIIKHTLRTLSMGT